MKLKKWLAVLLAGTMCAGMMTGCTRFTPINAEKSEESVSMYKGDLTMILPKKDEYLSYLHQAAKLTAETNGCKLTTVDCNEDQDKEIDYVTAAVAEGAPVIIIALADNTRAQDVIDAAGEVPVVFVNRAPADLSVLDENHIYIGSDENESGAYQGQALVDYIQGKGFKRVNYLMFNGNEGQDSTTKRTAGVLTELSKAGIITSAAADPVDCEYDRNNAMTAMNVMLANGVDMDEVDIIISNNDAMACGVIEALTQADIDFSHIAIVGVDGTAAGLQAITEGQMLATVYQNAIDQASGAVLAAINFASGLPAGEGLQLEADEENSSIFWVPFELVTADNAADYE